MSDAFTTALSDLSSGWRAAKPPNYLRVSQGVAATLKISRPGNAPAFWNPTETNYMVEPMDTLGSRVHAAVAFCGPAQSGKTVGLVDGWMAHAVVNDPGDMAIFQMTQDKAREFSKQRLDRAIRASESLKNLMGRAQDDNTHDKLFRNGMWVRVAWPTATNMSSTSYRYAVGTDYDRWKDDIDGEGDGFGLLRARTTTFMSRGMAAVESSPGRPLTDPRWQAATPHEAPPVGGILGIYNRSDRRRWYWKCPHCGEWMQSRPGLGLFNLPTDDELLDGIRTLNVETFAQQWARVICPSSGCIVKFEERHGMNLGGRWLADGLVIDDHDRISGTPRESDIAGFWLGGIAAQYVSWKTLILKHVQGLLEYALTGSELQLQTTMNTEQAVPYLSRALVEQTETQAPAERVEAELKRYIVPDETRFVLATVDIQGGRRARFVVQVHAWGPNREQWLVDRYAITKSKRPGIGEEFAPLDPASHAEDWDVLDDAVIAATYRTSDPEREIKVYRTGVDTGGEDGVTEKAYAWYRRLKARGTARRVFLLKGNNTKVDWFVRETKVGGKAGKGDVQLYLTNPNLLKDQLDACLRRTVGGPGHIHFPKWLPAAFFDELGAEVRAKNGTWSKVRSANESFDLAYMQIAVAIIAGVDKIKNWDRAPAWAQPLATNSEATSREARRQAAAHAQDVAAAAPAAPEAVAAPVNRFAPRPRRVSRSGYLK